MNPESQDISLMNKLMRWMRVTCQDTNPLISESLDHPLPFSKWWRLRFHLALCAVCGFYLNQLRTIQNLARRLGKEDNTRKDPIRLRPEFKEVLKKTLRAP